LTWGLFLAMPHAAHAAAMPPQQHTMHRMGSPHTRMTPPMAMPIIASIVRPDIAEMVLLLELLPVLLPLLADTAETYTPEGSLLVRAVEKGPEV